MKKSATTKKAYSFNSLKQHLHSPEEQRLFAQDACMLAVTEAVNDALDIAKVSRAELAQRIGRTKGFVSQVLNGSRNMTLRTLADLLWAIGCEVRGVQISALGESTIPYDLMDTWLDGETEVIATQMVDATEKRSDVALTGGVAPVAV